MHYRCGYQQGTVRIPRSQSRRPPTPTARPTLLPAPPAVDVAKRVILGVMLRGGGSESVPPSRSSGIVCLFLINTLQWYVYWQSFFLILLASYHFICVIIFPSCCIEYCLFFFISITYTPDAPPNTRWHLHHKIQTSHCALKARRPVCTDSPRGSLPAHNQAPLQPTSHFESSPGTSRHPRTQMHDAPQLTTG